MPHRTIAWAALSALGLGTTAAAADGLGVLYPQVSVVTDYRYDGFSSSNREPTVQLSLYLWRPDDWYAGIWVSGIDYMDVGDTSYELDLYAGRHLNFGNTRISMEMMATLFPDQDNDSRSYGFVQGILRVRQSFDWLEFEGTLGWAPNGSSGSGEAWRGALTATVKATDNVVFSAKYGFSASERGQDRRFWDFGVTYTWRSLALDLRYYDTNLEPSECYYTDWCDPGLAAKFTYTLPMVTL